VAVCTNKMCERHGTKEEEVDEEAKSVHSLELTAFF
jgi:hypothetical protein